MGSQTLSAVVLCLILVGVGGCGESDAASASGGGEAPAAAKAAEPGYVTGRVTMADGSPLRGEIKDIAINIYGVSEAAEKVSYGAAVKPDGTYRQKVAPGQYAFNPARITVLFNGQEFQFPLEPVGNLWNKNRDAEEAIVQDFVWKVTGPTPYGQSSGLNPGNATHWYGMSVGLRADGYRNDLGKAPTPIPDTSKLTFQLKPLSKAIDGSDVKPITMERPFSNSNYAPLDLNDLPPAEYELTGVATLPDGSTKPLLLQGKGDYPGYKPVVKLTVEKDNILGSMWKPPISFVID